MRASKRLLKEIRDKPLGPQGGKTNKDDLMFTSNQSRLWALETTASTQIEGYYDKGFKINDMDVFGSIVALPKSWYLWNVSTLEDINFDSLKLFEIVRPKINFLLLGTGLEMHLMPQLADKFKSIGITLETMSTVSIFCFWMLLLICRI